MWIRRKTVIEPLERLRKIALETDTLFKQSVLQYQVVCKHEHQAECEYQPGYFLSSLGPMRVCLDCGLSEDGWGPGYKVLTDDKQKSFQKIERNLLYKRRHGLRITNDMKGALIRKESNVKKLIEEKLIEISNQLQIEIEIK